jgi:hypothetical protein
MLGAPSYDALIVLADEGRLQLDVIWGCQAWMYSGLTERCS